MAPCSGFSPPGAGFVTPAVRSLSSEAPGPKQSTDTARAPSAATRFHLCSTCSGEDDAIIACGANIIMRIGCDDWLHELGDSIADGRAAAEETAQSLWQRLVQQWQRAEKESVRMLSGTPLGHGLICSRPRARATCGHGRACWRSPACGQRWCAAVHPVGTPRRCPALPSNRPSILPHTWPASTIFGLQESSGLLAISPRDCSRREISSRRTCDGPLASAPFRGSRGSSCA